MRSAGWRRCRIMKRYTSSHTVAVVAAEYCG